MLERADIIFVMDLRVEKHVAMRFAKILDRKQVIRLDIADEYDFMTPELISLLTEKLTPHLGPPDSDITIEES